MMKQTGTPLRLALTATALGLALSACASTGGGTAPSAGPSASPLPATSAGSASASAPASASSGGGGSAPSATPAPSTPPTPPAGAAACTGSQIAVSAGQSNGAAGHIGARVIFKNTSSAACTLYGFPGVAGLDAAGKQQVQAKRTTNGYLGSASASTVLVAPGATASALVGGVDVPSGNLTSCPSYPALLVTPPGTKTSTKVALQMPGCPTLVVYPVVAGVPAS
ncbi:DUF4232 domain-containing protein [Streptacidiphilus cavernicola]|uniref:DUF4232 domain-containing protein n=1 Tax=Streptacidiphilus cavernicola TaxID=3342716 RepID=A0ABV6W3D9_9ACTN